MFLAGGRGVLLKVTPNGVEDFKGGLDGSSAALLDLESGGFATFGGLGKLVLDDGQRQRSIHYMDPTGFIATSALGDRADDILIGGYHCVDNSKRDQLDYGIYNELLHCGTGFLSLSLIHYDGNQFTPVDLGDAFRRFRYFNGTGT